MDERLQRILEVAFPVSADLAVTRGVSEGIALADDLIENTRILKNAAGNDLRGHIRRAGIMFRVRDLCEREDMPFSAEIVPMPHGPWHWLEIRSGNFVAHVCRTSAPHAFPEDTLSRQDARLRNQDDLFAPRTDRGDVIVKIREFYAWLTYGVGQKGSLEHLCWAMPPADDGDWLAHRDILHYSSTETSQPGEVLTEKTPPDLTSGDLNLRFQEHIERTLSEKNQEVEKD